MAAARPNFGKAGAGEGNRNAEEGKAEGLPGGLVQGPDGLGITFKPAPSEPEPFDTRIKMPTKAEEEKASKEDKSRDRDPIKISGTAAEKRVLKLQAELQEQADILATVMAFKLPVTSVYTGVNSPKAIEALLNIAKKRPKMLDAMEKVSEGFDALAVGKFVIGLGVALQVDSGRLAPDSFPAVATGVTAVIAEHLSEDGGETNPNVTTMPEPAHAVRFQPVS